jgi:hypothetical protein
LVLAVRQRVGPLQTRFQPAAGLFHSSPRLRPADDKRNFVRDARDRF